MILGRREVWPALAILGVALLTLAVTLKSAGQDMPLQPLWVMAGLFGLYIALAAVATGWSWRLPVTVLAMIAAQAILALLMGYGYSALEGQGRAMYDALLHGLWDYVPGTALQFAFACFVGIALAAQLGREPSPAVATVEDEETGELPDLTELEPQAALSKLTAVPGVAGALLADGAQLAASGVWEDDPGAALERVQALAKLLGAGLNSCPLAQVNLLLRNADGRLAALLVTPETTQQQAHALLRALWAVEAATDVPSELTEV